MHALSYWYRYLWRVQEKLLKGCLSERNRVYVPFDGPYMSMIVPMTKHKPHRFQVVVQNMAPEPKNLSFRCEFCVPAACISFMQSAICPSISKRSYIHTLHVTPIQISDMRMHTYTSYWYSRNLAVWLIYLSFTHSTSLAKQHVCLQAWICSFACVFLSLPPCLTSFLPPSLSPPFSPSFVSSVLDYNCKPCR